jgi:hypothetical protein
MRYTANYYGIAAPVHGRLFSFQGTFMDRITICLPKALIDALRQEATSRGLRLGTYIRSQLKNAKPINIHKTN